MQGNYDTLLRSTKSVEVLTNAGVDVACIGGEQICEWSRATAQEKIAALLANYSDDIDAVISCNDDMALGANSFYVDRPGPGQHQDGLCVDSAAHLRRGAGDGALLPAGQGDAGRARGIGARRERDGALRGGCFGSSAQAGQRPRTGRILLGCAGCIGRGMVVH